ncbi:hypothetical protein LCGC14_0603390 [marine sediment metagenome]|uniref:VanZ-like domain-containing protein n=1 Tax=marine sediment metagenome TaxID=412755 RepID=A0A0F9RES4_9ZZZZ
MNKKFLKKAPVLILTIIIFILSSFPQKIPTGGFGKKKLDILFILLHIGEFGLFSILLMYGFWPNIKSYFLLMFSILYGYLDEVHQYFVPTRYYDIIDIQANIIGAILGICIYLSLVFIIKVLNAMEEEYKRETDLMGM